MPYAMVQVQMTLTELEWFS